MTAHSATARWGLLVTTLLLVSALVVTGATSYVDARATAAAVGRSLAGDLLEVRRDLRDAGSFDPPVLAQLLADLEPSGVRYIAVVAPDGILAAAGTPAASVTWQPPGPQERTEEAGRGRRPRDERAPSDRGARQAPPVQRVEGTRLYRVVGWLEPPADLRRRRTANDRRGPLGPDRATLVIEVQPRLADVIVRRAVGVLVAQAAAALVLLAAALAFWRHSVREDRRTADAARDQHLRTLGEMSAVLGHELRNPLASLKGHAQLLLEKLPPGQLGHEGARTIVTESLRLEALANQILEFVKTGTLHFSPANPRALAQDAIDASGVDHVRLDALAPASWRLDRDRMLAVIVNLLQNARASSPADAPIDLRIALERRQLVVEVSDRGEGLAAGDVERAFEPFFTTRVHGTGLGLALARRVVEGHGGRITAANREGGGASFRITLPDAPEAA